MKRQLAALAGVFVWGASTAAFAWDAESRDSVGGKAEWRGNTYLQAVFRAHPSLIPPGPAQFAAIWVKQAGPDWVARHGMTSQQYQEELDKQTKQGFCPIDVTGYRKPASRGSRRSGSARAAPASSRATA